MIPTLIGYFPKRTMKRPDWLKTKGVEEICSVSTCISTAPDQWYQQWKHNEMWVYDTPELAWSVVPEDLKPEFDLYAYRMFPIQFFEGKQQPFEIPTLQVQPIPASFERLGYDAVSRSHDSSFECSPLSCNGMAENVMTNRHCLADTEEMAFQLALKFDTSNAEPGPYFVIEVWRLVK